MSKILFYIGLIAVIRSPADYEVMPYMIVIGCIMMAVGYYMNKEKANASN